MSESVYEALLWSKRMSAADVASRLAEEGLELSRQHAWRLIKGTRPPSPEQQRALDAILALGHPDEVLETRKGRGPRYAIARLEDGEFTFLFARGGTALPLFAHRKLADWTTDGLARPIPNVVTVPMWIGYAARTAAVRAAPDEFELEHLMFVEEEGVAIGGTVDAQSRVITRVLKELLLFGVMSDRALLERVELPPADSSEGDASEGTR